MRRSLLLAVIVLIALPGLAVAAPVKLSPRASTVSAAGVATVEAANPNRHALRGTAKVTVGDRVVARRGVRLAKRSVTTIVLRFDGSGRRALRAAGGRAKVTLRLRRAGGRPQLARRTLKFRFAAAVPEPPVTAPSPPAGGVTGDSDGGPAPATPAVDRWVGRMGTEGPYDDLELTVADGQMTITRAPAVPVSCLENGGSYRSALSFEIFAAPGPWTLGVDGDVSQQGIAVNQLVTSGARSISYKVHGTRREADRIVGELGMSFFDSRYDVFTNTITFINCAGAQSFEAVPAG